MDQGTDLGMHARSGRSTRLITVTVALFAIAVFAYSGSKLFPSILAYPGAEYPPPQDQITGFLLNIALILFAWKRSNELKRVAAERDAALNRVHDLAYIDEVTGLHNRRFLREEILALRSGAKAGALLLIDLDRFKRVNDLYGHAAGDDLLRVVAGKLRATCPAGSACIRLGGDEFAVLLVGDAARSSGPDEVADSLIEVLRQPIPVGSTVAVIGASIGIALYSQSCSEPGDLLKRADMAMYEAKRQGRNRAVIFDRAMEAELMLRVGKEADIRRGIEEGEFVPYFQPIVDLGTNDVAAFEVLARWRHPADGLLEPDEFIDVAEETAMISDLSLAVMRQALLLAREWPERIRIAVNVTPMQFADPMLAENILGLLAQTGFPPQRLVVEVKERSLLNDLEAALAVIDRLKAAGIGISVDDFGTGYVELTRLEAIPFDQIKIDRNFVTALEDDSNRIGLVEAVAALGKGLKVPVTAEGVETQAIRDKLARFGCVDAQGWHYGKALNASEVTLGFGFGQPEAA